ncbi:cellulose synthase subunit BcsC-related outer membrane protein [Vibrio olivae]|uniref:Cellulose synthase subunit BcsC-related outer membrane protein n=1 Tax=Vibrio olivae TaxID=1243002 RepID=A0ABV5HPA2_9VIBR
MMKNNALKLFSTFVLLEALQLTAATPAWAQDPALDSLLEQAQYWHEKSNDGLAKESLQKVLMVDPNQPQALYLMSLWAQENGQSAESAQWRARLEKAHPNAPQLQQLSRSQTLSQLPKTGIDQARRQAQSGDIQGAIATWNTLFQGNPPPMALAPEYYLTMSGDKGMYNQAVSGLAKLAKQNPTNSSVGIAYGQVLTYREATRRQGIRQLESYAPQNKNASDALRQALLWLEPKASDQPMYQRWALAHPQDKSVLAHYQSAVGGEKKRNGFNELNRGNLSQAQSEFQRVLNESPNDADALAGMGYVALNRGNYASAADFLKRSAAQGGNQATKRRQQASEAQFLAQLEQAQQAYQAGNTVQALELSASLMNRKGEVGRGAKLFRADVLRHNGDYAQAESLLLNVLKEQPKNQAAKESLYYVYIEQNQTDEATRLLASLPQEVQRRIRSEDSYSNMRDLAKQAVEAGNVETAIVILDNGLQRLPNNPWLRLELARLYQQQDNNVRAQEVMAPLQTAQATPEDLYVAALFASGEEQWKQTNILLGRIPQSQRSAQASTLYAESKFYLNLDLARSYLTQGQTSQEQALLQSMQAQAITNPLWSGKLAQLLVKSGDVNRAIEVIHANQEQGIEGNAGDYADQVAVLYQAGLQQEAQSLLNHPQIIANSTPLQLARARHVYVINQADTLREQGQYAPAYDMLTAALQVDPTNRDLMLAMGRLYQSGKLNEQALIVYQYLLDNQKDTPEQDALVGAINIALVKGQAGKARELSGQLQQVSSPSRLLLLARIDEAQGKHAQAMANLRQARSKLLGLKANYASTSPMVGGLVMADNPFAGSQTTVHSAQTYSVYGETMPWQVNTQTSLNGETINQRTDLPKPTAEQQTLADVNRLILQITERTSSWVQGGIEVRGRDGENGLSRLTEARAPLEWSTVPFGDARLSLNIDAVTLDSGTTSADANRRFGTGALIQGQVALAEGVSSLDGDVLPDVASQGAQSQSGVELAMSLRDKHYQLDIGTTPLGLEQTTLVGGITLIAPLGDYTDLSLSAERRAVKDSLLSYVGMKDSFSGKYWGQVTQNGLSIQLNYDDGEVGYYANAGAWRYVGHNVEDNNAVKVGAGMYLRPYKTDSRQLQIGSHLSYQDFDDNLSYYSYGHGGYFSPQNYVSVSFPVEYTQELSKLSFSVGGALGYQSYSQDEADYFPGHSALQSTLDGYATAGLVEEARYSAESTDGIGYSFQARLGYKIKRDLMLEARVAYDTFGDYNESKAQLSLRHSFHDY